MGEKFLVFDLDGTLVDTKQAVREAYLASGVIMPESAWGKPWWQWLESVAAHRHKIKVYPEYIPKYAQPLPLLKFAVEFNVPVITSASWEAVRAIKEHFAPSLNVIATECSWFDKCDHLRRISIRGIYVDDDLTTRNHVKENTSWETVSPQEFLASSLLQERINDSNH